MAEYIVERMLYGKQTYMVEAASKAEAIRKVRSGDAEDVSFEIVSAAQTMTATRTNQSDGAS